MIKEVLYLDVTYFGDEEEGGGWDLVYCERHLPVLYIARNSRSVIERIYHKDIGCCICKAPKGKP